ncbi:fibronectin type III domain-containing protein [Kribbella sp. CA-293567]|uniref:fibronectin type III domain-containing protein n=1 Tax=Kribbella sp. CA-293567 TaxID=3002436 RepID=UPI0022DDED12|nr:fibronectin type III domain-containing protein [Kribbella sp. CA-293567]WBQ08423.1 fibronectin type III domain-containing protein [Kribbella sp. CA-293567]
MKPLTAPSRRFTLRGPGRVPGGQRGRSEGWRPRAALAAVVAVCMVVTGLAVAGAGNASPGLSFAQQGQWIYNSTLGTIFHVNGSTKNVDNQVPLPGAGPGTQIVESDKSGFALAQGRIHEFGKSDLRVLDPRPAPAGEQAVGLSAGAAVFAVYRQAGSIVRLGDRPAVANPGVPLGPPVVTSTGTLWVHRPDSGQLCQLPIDAERLSCPARAPLGHAGALTVIGDDQVVFVDTTGRVMSTVGDDGLGRQVDLPVRQLPTTAVIAQNDVGGRVAIVDPQRSVLHLVDTAQLTGGKSDAAPIETTLSKGRYERIASSGNSLGLIDDSTDTLVTVDRDGREKTKRQIPAPSKKATVGKSDRSGLYRGGDTRLYVASRSGEQVMVVDETGQVTSVDTGTPLPEKPKKPESKPTGKPTQRPSQPPQQPQPRQRPTQQPSQEPTQPLPQQPTEQQTKPPEPRKPQNPRTTRPTSKPDRPTARPTEKQTSERPSTRPPRTTEPPVPPAPPKANPRPPVQASRPGAPRSVSGKAGVGSAVINWDAATPNGAAVTGYQISWTGGRRDVGATVRTINITGLANGTAYTFTVRAVNRVGAGPGSSTGRLVPNGGAPDAPGNFTVRAGTGRVTMTWARPDLKGGTLRGYDVAANVTGGSGTSKAGTATATSWTFTGLTNGATYRVTVRAVVTDAQGRLVLGRTASRTIQVGGGGGGSDATLTASRGADTTHGSGERSCDPPGCAFIRIVGRGLKPNTTYHFEPFTTRWQPSNGGADLTTDSAGNIEIDDRFATDAPGQEVWVVATADGEPTVTSNKFTWRSS